MVSDQLGVVMAKNILVVGGLGYIGCIISDLLSKKGHNVDIVDMAIFDNEDVKASIDYRCLDIKNISNMQKNFIYDQIIWACDFDINLFYSQECFSDLHNKMKIKFDELCNDKMIYLSSFVTLMDDNENMAYKAHLQENDEKVKSRGGSVFYLGSLHGPSPRMRWDTYVNLMLYSFLVKGSVLLEEGWLKQFPVCSVLSAASNIVDEISTDNIEKESYIFGETVSILEVAHRVRTCVETDESLQIYTGKHEKSFKSKWKYEESVSTINIEESVGALIKGLELHQLDDFMNDKYNNGIIFSAIEKGLRFLNNIKSE